jgi:hypothetical protein
MDNLPASISSVIANGIVICAFLVHNAFVLNQHFCHIQFGVIVERLKLKLFDLKRGDVWFVAATERSMGLDDYKQV